MQAQQDSPPHADDTTSGDSQEQLSPTSPMDAEGEHGHKKKSVIGKVKDKAKKLKTKMKIGGSGDNNDSSSAASSNEEESGSDLQQKAGEERDVVVTPGLKEEAYEAPPDSHTDAAAGVGEKYDQMQPEGEPEMKMSEAAAPPATDVVTPGMKGEAYEAVPDPHTDTPVDVGEKLGQLKLEDDPETAMRNEEAPAALGESSADIGQGTEANRDTPVEDGKNVEGDDASGKPTPPEKDSTTKDHIVEGAAAAAAAGATGMGLKSHDDRENMEAPDRGLNESKPSITSRAADTVAGLKNTIASKLGYAPSTTPGTKPPAPTSSSTTESTPQTAENKSVLQKLQESAAGATAAVSSRLGYGSPKGAPDQTGAEGAALGGDGKPYTQKAKEAAFDAKDAVAAPLTHGGTATEGDPASGAGDKSYLQKARDAAIGAKDVAAAKIGYGATDEQNKSPSAAPARFHPGEEDEALSQLITEKMSSGVATVKDTLLRPFSAAASKTGPPTPTTTPYPSSAAAVERDPANTLVTEEKPGIVGKVTGAVSSLLGTSASGKKKSDESAAKAADEPIAKAAEDPQAQAAGA